MSVSVPLLGFLPWEECWPVLPLRQTGFLFLRPDRESSLSCLYTLSVAMAYRCLSALRVQRLGVPPFPPRGCLLQALGHKNEVRSGQAHTKQLTSCPRFLQPAQQPVPKLSPADCLLSRLSWDESALAPPSLLPSSRPLLPVPPCSTPGELTSSFTCPPGQGLPASEGPHGGDGCPPGPGWYLLGSRETTRSPC